MTQVSVYLKPLANLKTVRILAIAIPIAVAVLIGIRQKIDLGTWTSYLPHIIGAINSLTAIMLLLGLWAIKQKKINLHQQFMMAAFSLGAVFLVLYILYHVSNPSTPYGGEGIWRTIYYFLLISHILLSIGVVYYVLMALHYAANKQFDLHRKVVKIAYPVWLYVSVSGVAVYLLISPYYS